MMINSSTMATVVLMGPGISSRETDRQSAVVQDAPSAEQGADGELGCEVARDRRTG